MAVRPCRAQRAAGLILTQQGRTRAFSDRLLGQSLLVGGNGIRLDDRIVVVVQVEDIRSNPQANGVAFAPVTVDYHSHGALLDLAQNLGQPVIIV